MSILFYCLVLAHGLAEAATFQYQFNNVEQGPGSTAHASIYVGSKKAKAPPAPVLEEEESSESIPTHLPAAPALKAQAEEAESTFPWRLSLGASGVRQNKEMKAQGVSLRAGYSLLKGLGLAAFTGIRSGKNWDVGGELEITPIRLSSFGWKDWVEASLLLGGTRWQPGELPAWTFAHAGARLDLNMGERFGWNLVLRTNLTDRKSLSYRQWEGGLHVRF